jgi:predicted O-linked N-acetylglucosamine transferase (SPINDLY family)
MTGQKFSTDLITWQQNAQQHWLQGNYSKAAELYEQAIQADSEIKAYYWKLGLLLLLQGQEAEAQTTWLLGMADGELAQIEVWSRELFEVLQAEANRQEALDADLVAWVIRQHMREIVPQNSNNLLKVIQLSIKLKTFSYRHFQDSGVIQALESESDSNIDSELLMNTLSIALKHVPHALALSEFVQACSLHAQDQKTFIETVMLAAVEIAYTERRPAVAAKLAETCLRLDNKHPEVLKGLAPFYQNAGEYDKGIEIARLACSLEQDLPEQIYCNFLLLRGLMTAGGYWDESLAVFRRHQELLSSFIKSEPTSISPVSALRLFAPLFYSPYFEDDPKTHRPIHNQVVQICQEALQSRGQAVIAQYQQRSRNAATHKSNRPLKIGYLSHCFKRHSVGWLSRWLLKYHNRNQFEIHVYFIGYSSQLTDPIQDWFVQHADYAHTINAHSPEIAEQIYQDQIDILVDLDSITLDKACAVLALKPAPIQVTWLGWDASGLPAIDYFIADPYVLPDAAQEYYSEKVWRLPQTYLAVDGFEIGIPSLHRNELSIPDDAVIFLSSQKGHKRHLNTSKLQMKIIKEVPNSYFLIKGFANQDSIKNFFLEIAKEEGVESDRIRFLPDVDAEDVHRANLAIADVVLDTYPYNGATTTLETLWMGIPLVTRVGEQFAARNSYTMLMNVGVTEGIAWTDEEYVEWGIRLGRDEALRQQVAWKLWRSRQTAPLWDAKKFTRDMENAYQQMWSNFVDSNS